MLALNHFVRSENGVAPLYPPALAFLAGKEQVAYVRVLYGPRFPNKVALYGVGQFLLGGRQVLVLDGANSLDAYYLARLARTAGQSPAAVLSRLYVSRAFTCYQMADLVLDKLPAVIGQMGFKVVVCAGLLETFYDEDVPLPEAGRLLARVLGQIRHLARQKTVFVITSPEPSEKVKNRVVLLNMLKREAALVVRIEREESGWKVQQEKPAPV